MRPRPLPMRSAEEWENAAHNRPRGIAAAVVFDWASLTLIAAILARAVVQYGLASRQTAAAAFLLLVLGLPLAALGEALRRGLTGARLTQVLIASLIGAGNLIGLIADLRALLGGTPRWSASLPALVLAGFVVWGLTRPQTIAWFAETARSRARSRHGGRWLPLTLGAGIVAGLIAAAISFI
jgi:hypothetical protein